MLSKLFKKTVMVFLAMTVFVFNAQIDTHLSITSGYTRSKELSIISEKDLHMKIISAVKKNLGSAVKNIAEIAPPRLSPIRAPKTAALEIVVAGEVRGGRLPIELSVVENKRVVRKQRIFVAIDFYTSTWATKVELESGHTLSKNDLHEIKIASKQVKRDQITNPDLIIGASLKRDLSANTPLKTSLLRIPKLVKRGAIVELIFQKKGIFLTAAGEALGDGKRSDTIRVKNLKSKKIVTGKVIGVNQVNVGH